MKQINLQMTGLDGNAFAIMGAFQRQAIKEGWSKQEINFVLDDARSKDYSHLVSTICNHCVDPLGMDEDQWDGGWDDYDDDDEEEDYAGLRTWRGEKANV